MSESRQALIEDEWLIVRHSGEIPEIALSSVLYYLTEDPEGPHIDLSEEELEYLTLAAEERYYEIVLRDLILENRDKTIYRGIQRTIYNYNRFLAFCKRRNRDSTSFQSKVAQSLLAFLEQETKDVLTGHRQCSLNISYEQVITFGKELGIHENDLPAGLAKIF